SAIGRNVIHITATTEREAREQSKAGIPALSYEQATENPAVNYRIFVVHTADDFTAIPASSVFRTKEKGRISDPTPWLVVYRQICRLVHSITGCNPVQPSDSDLALRRCSSSRATLTSCRISSPAFVPISSIRANASREVSNGFPLLSSAWRQAISPRTAVTMKIGRAS